MNDKLTLLWTDDDGADQFVHERYLIERSGLWSIVWALDVSSAMRELCTRRIDAIILDQMLPRGGRTSDHGVYPVDVWGGCVLLYWLRTGDYPAGWPQGARMSIEGFAARPLADNAGVPLLISSAFHDDSVAASLAALDRNLDILPKPIDEVELMVFIRAIESRQHGRH